ncbi:MAG TPA: YggS family pyridoxal phosphate-dependent enzyme [Candidatus Scybalocola faecigallinarum]|uniref:Pyridoxal phosphate homeostasis protein n=1 Tax=Candidatus Scybalocola faecigallinarum TaxID=2840941 RepID=A0A9D1JQU0_9FIRM|nr:YggS family pyridoxal phosphate-dependent enzyme [Candidatus Scybalocola faecigallinarum]
MDERINEIAQNIKIVRDNIEKACSRCGRDPKEVTLIAVSKTKPVEDVRAAMAAGMEYFGENKVQELTMKMDTITEPLHWNMIGHLQKNKVKYIVGRAELIHSVDSLDLAQKIQSEAAKKNAVANILLEVNVSGEESKFGIRPEQLEDLVRQIAVLPNVHIKGLMTVAPFTEDPEENRQYFRNLRNLAVDIKSKNIDNVTMSVLSMGMTGDYMVAIEEGATMVRVGTGIFGERNYVC